MMCVRFLHNGTNPESFTANYDAKIDERNRKCKRQMLIFLYLCTIMWQRIQTLYLAISLGLVLAMCFGTAYHVADPDGMVEVSYWRLQKPYFAILLGILTGLITLALFSFKSLILEMRLAALGGIVALGMQLWLAWMYFTWEGPVFSWTVIFPLAIAVFNFLGARSCFQDQLMVESAMRVRDRRRHSKKK